MGPCRHRRAVKLKWRIAFGAALSGWRVDGVALGAFHYFRGVAKVRATRNTTASVLRNQARLPHFSASLWRNGSFSSVRSFSLTECSSRVARPVPRLRDASEGAVKSSLARPGACRSSRPRVVLQVCKYYRFESFLLAFLPCPPSSRLGAPRTLFRHAFWANEPVIRAQAGVRESYIPICPDLSRSAVCSSGPLYVDNPRSCFDLSGGVCLASPRNLSDRTSLTRFLSANAPANS